MCFIGLRNAARIKHLKLTGHFNAFPATVKALTELCPSIQTLSIIGTTQTPWIPADLRSFYLRPIWNPNSQAELSNDDEVLLTDLESDLRKFDRLRRLEVYHKAITLKPGVRREDIFDIDLSTAIDTNFPPEEYMESQKIYQVNLTVLYSVGEAIE